MTTAKEEAGEMVDLFAPATEKEIWVLQNLGLPVTPQLVATLRSLIIAVASFKGGVGKTEFSKEIAYLLGGILFDFDWDEGGITKKWGYFPETRKKAPLLDAFDNGKPPTPLSGGQHRADLVPSHPDLALNQPEQEYITEILLKWQQTYGRPVIVDNHPGGGDLAFGAMAAASAVVVVSPLAQNELRALRGMVTELPSYPLIIIPYENGSPYVPPQKLVRELESISKTSGVPLGPSVGYNQHLRSRSLRMAVSAAVPVPVRYLDYVEEVKLALASILTFAASTLNLQEGDD